MEVFDNPGGIAAASPSATTTLRRVSLFDQININVFWIANNFHLNVQRSSLVSLRWVVISRCSFLCVLYKRKNASLKNFSSSYL